MTLVSSRYVEIVEEIILTPPPPKLDFLLKIKNYLETIYFSFYFLYTSAKFQCI